MSNLRSYSKRGGGDVNVAHVPLKPAVCEVISKIKVRRAIFAPSFLPSHVI